jgi:GTP-binding protein
MRRTRALSAEFIRSAASKADFPDDTGRELAVVGRSNSGKSSAINAIVGMKKLARVSKTPGRTQLINFFALGEDRRLVDLPGYGFAQVPEPLRQRWRGLIEDYFDSRRSLAGLFVTVDIRRGLKDLDWTMLDWVGDRGVAATILLTKADKLSRGAALARRQALRRELPAEIGLIPFSALDRHGVDEARAELRARLAL